MSILRLLCIALFLIQIPLFAQEVKLKVAAPVESDFAGAYHFLSSAWMQGRETGTQGEYLAADYIVSLMDLFGIEPNGDFKFQKEVEKQQRYFQNFELVSPYIMHISITFTENEKIT